MKHQAVIGLGFGDEGKGSTVDYLCLAAQREAQPVTAVVRFNGGCQAAHTVVLPDGRHHTFSQHGSGTLRNVPTILTKFVAVEPIGFMRERQHLLDMGMPDGPFVTVDEECLITTPWHMALNRAAEAQRGALPHGTCGVGVGETMAYALDFPGWAPRVKDIHDEDTIRAKLHALRTHCQSNGVDPGTAAVSATVQAYRLWAFHVVISHEKNIRNQIGRGPCIFEGAQGVLLDEWYGFHPHTTWSTTTFENIWQLVDDPTDVQRLGVLRTYMTRHGAGPFPTEFVKSRDVLDLTDHFFPEAHNGDAGHQGIFRRGDFDAPLARYAIAACGGVDGIVLSHMDVADRTSLDMCKSYVLDDQLWEPEFQAGHDLDRQAKLTARLRRVIPLYVNLDAEEEPWVETVENQLRTDVVLTSWGPTAEDKRIEREVLV